MWILQEVLLAKDLILICGSRRLDWARLEMFASTIQDLMSATGYADPFIIHLLQTKGLRLVERKQDWSRKYLNKSATIPIMIFIEEFSEWESYDPRDKVYALVGLTRDAVPIDYRLSVDAAFETVLKFAVCKTSHLHSGAKVQNFATLLADSMGVLLTPALT